MRFIRERLWLFLSLRVRVRLSRVTVGDSFWSWMASMVSKLLLWVINSVEMALLRFSFW